MPRADEQSGDRYVVGELLGRGGMGVVYAAWDRRKDREVALKRLLLPDTVRAADTARAMLHFEREYHTLSQLAHPHVIAVHDYGVDESGPYYTMERLRGSTLQAIAPLPWREACRLIRDVASALGLIHARRFVHRDITPLNIYCSDAFGAKLFDFGAMVTQGVPSHVVGTPAFMAPECVQHAGLDGQTDLFSLGATLYFALTAEHAYPAHSIASLRAHWLTPPALPSQLQAGIPAALDKLVLALLALDTNERPRSAIEVYEQLTAIADLPREERADTAVAYLSKPELVGRAGALATLAHGVAEAAAGRGEALVLLAAGGLGRSRLLDAAALEAKLRGLSVARADASDGPGIPFAALSRLLRGMLDEDPELQGVLCAPELAALSGPAAPEFFESLGRERALARANELLVQACSRRAWALLIDDVHAIDEVSRAFLSSLALQTATRPLLLVTTLAADTALRSSESCTILERASRKLALDPLAKDQCRALLASLFGEVPNLDLLAALSEAACEGKPRAILELAERLIEHGLCRYQDGGFWISSDRDALARCVASASDLSHELAQLPPLARELLEVLALDVDAIMSAGDYASLLEAGDATALYAALAELSSRRWLAVSADRARFIREERRNAVALSLTPERRHKLHARLAERASQLPISKIYAAYHFIHAEAHAQAIETLESFWREIDNKLDPEILRQPVCLLTFEAAQRLPLAAGAHPTLHAHHAAGAAMNMLMHGMPERVAPQLPAIFRALAPFSGLADYAELEELAPQQRVMQALTRAHARCDVPGKGGLPDVFRALRRQAQICIGSAATAYLMNDPSLLDLIPDLRPFSGIAAPLALVSRMIDAITKITRGRYWLALDVFQDVFADLRGPLGAQLDPLSNLTLTRTSLAYLGRMYAEIGSEASLSLIEEDSALRPDTAESTRAIYWLAHGDLAQADAARRRSEIYSAQAGSHVDTRIVELPAHLTLYALCDDVLGLRRTQQALQQVTRSRPHWQVRADLARVHGLRCRGAYEQALEQIECVLSTQPPESFDWVACAAAHLELLVLLRKHAAAAALADQYAATAEGAGAPGNTIALPRARAHAELGHPEQAERCLTAAKQELRARGAGGVVAAAVDEVGAHVALLRGDRAAFVERLDAFGACMQRAKHPQLAARYNSLMRDASSRGVSVDGAYALASEEQGFDLAALWELARASTDDATFYQRVLEALLEQTGAAAGVLYAWSPAELRCVAQAGDSAFGDNLDEEAARFWSQRTAACEPVTGTTRSGELLSAADNGPPTGAGHTATMLCVEHVRQGLRLPQGVLVLDLGPAPRPLRVGLAEFGAVLAERLRRDSRSQ